MCAVKSQLRGRARDGREAGLRRPREDPAVLRHAAPSAGLRTARLREPRPPLSVTSNANPLAAAVARSSRIQITASLCIHKARECTSTSNKQQGQAGASPRTTKSHGKERRDGGDDTAMIVPAVLPGGTARQPPAAQQRSRPPAAPRSPERQQPARHTHQHMAQHALDRGRARRHHGQARLTRLARHRAAVGLRA